jgi:hypothetical protein
MYILFLHIVNMNESVVVQDEYEHTDHQRMVTAAGVYWRDKVLGLDF